VSSAACTGGAGACLRRQCFNTRPSLRTGFLKGCCSLQYVSLNPAHSVVRRTISSRDPCSAVLLGMLWILRRQRLEVAVHRKALRLHAQHQLDTVLAYAPLSNDLHARILRDPPAGFGRFCIAALGTSPPIGSPSMSRTSRPDAIAEVLGIDPAVCGRYQRTLVMVCRDVVKSDVELRGWLRRAASAPPMSELASNDGLPQGTKLEPRHVMPRYRE
jgi:hypothetical protein